MGFVSEELNETEKRSIQQNKVDNMAVVYGKEASMWKVLHINASHMYKMKVVERTYLPVIHTVYVSVKFINEIRPAGENKRGQFSCKADPCTGTMHIVLCSFLNTGTAVFFAAPLCYPLPFSSMWLHIHK